MIVTVHVHHSTNMMVAVHVQHSTSMIVGVGQGWFLGDWSWRRELPAGWTIVVLSSYRVELAHVGSLGLGSSLASSHGLASLLPHHLSDVVSLVVGDSHHHDVSTSSSDATHIRHGLEKLLQSLVVELAIRDSFSNHVLVTLEHVSCGNSSFRGQQN